MKLISSFLLAAAVLCAQTALTRKDISAGWIQLFDGETLFGWTAENGSTWRAENGAIIADSGKAGWLRSNSAFGDYVLKLEFRTAADGNSGVFLRSAAAGQPHVTGYELQIYDTQPQGYNTGSLVNHAKTPKPAKIKGGQWMAYEVTNIGDHFIVKLDGKKVLDAHDAKSAVGHIGLQYNVNRKVEFRNIRLQPLGLKPIFDGKSLAGWKEVKPAKPRPNYQPPVWAVRDKQIHVEKGPGQLETEGQWADFVLQLDIRTNPADEKHHPNSGVFIRGDANGYWTGYESQIRNEYKDGDRTQPVDWGTGAIYNRKATRKVVSSDGTYFTKTIVARGRRLAVWIDGYPVTDWEDTRPEGTNARQQARVKGGTFSLQAHDPTTNLDFRNLRAGELPTAK